MIVNIYHLVRPADLVDGQVIDTDQHGPVTVDEVRRKNGEVTILGFRPGSTRRVSVTVKPHDDVAVVPPPAGRQEVWGRLLQAVHVAAATWASEHPGSAVHDAPWGTQPDVALIRVEGVEFWVEGPAPERPTPDPDDEAF